MENSCFRLIRAVLVGKSEFLCSKRKYLLTNSRYLFLCKQSYIHTSVKYFSEDNNNPFKKTYRVLSEDFKELKNKVMGTPRNNLENTKILPTHCDVLIIGGGVMGFSIAYWLQQRALNGLKIVVVEKDPSYLKSTTALSVGGIRQQFSLQENIELSLYSAEFLRNIKYHLGIDGEDSPNINFNPAGYLFLASEKSAKIVEDNVRLQNSVGAKVELLSPDKLKAKFPWLNTDGVALASHGLENEGWFDPWSLLHAFKRKALTLGTEQVTGEVTRFGFESPLNIVSDNDPFSTQSVKEVGLPDGTEVGIKFAICIIAAGAMSGDVARLAGVGIGSGARIAPLPIAPRKRFVHVIHCPDGPGFNCPFLIDNTGAYLRREGFGDNYICGISPPEGEEPSTDNLDIEGNYFEEKVWPVIASRVPAFEKCKLQSSWAGFYDVNLFDENAFLGLHPGYHNLYLATGFSGHGIQQAPAIGRAMMELIIDSGFRTINLSRFNYSRYLEDQPLYESNII